jgi:hypothetical protein
MQEEKYSLGALQRGSRPVPDSVAYEFIKSVHDPSKLFDRSIQSDFLCRFHEWVQESKNNNLVGLKDFNKLSYVHGSTQAFDFFYAEYKDRRMRCFRGEFAYHWLSWRNNYPNWAYIEDDEIKENDAFIVSVPFSDYGAIHPKLEAVLDKCDALGVPVFIDCAYYVMARNVNFSLERECIKAVAFSMSKGFYGTEKIRIGMRCKRDFNDDPIDVFNSLGQVSTMGCIVGNEICNHFSPDYVQDKYKDKQVEVCNHFNLTPTDCISFGLADINDERFSAFKRGTDWRRVTISGLLGDIPLVSNGTPLEERYKGV